MPLLDYYIIANGIICDEARMRSHTGLIVFKIVYRFD